MVASAATASGATRFASPGGTGSSPCLQSAPCTLTTAVSGAVSGDTVRLLPGTHTLTSALIPPAPGIAIEAEPGAARPAISYTGPTGDNALRLPMNTTLRGFDVLGATTGGVFLVAALDDGAVIDRMQLHNSGVGGAVLGASGANVRDSVIASSASPGTALVLTGTLTGSTVVADADQNAVAVLMPANFWPLGAPQHLTIRNTIILGMTFLNGGGLVTPTIDVDYSAFLGGWGNFGGDLIQGTHNLLSSPSLVSPTGSADIHQIRPSSSINAGSAQAAAAAGSTADIDGQPRVLAGAPDVGADEMPTSPGAVTGTPGSVGVLTATLTGTVDPGGLTTSYHFEYRTGFSWIRTPTVTLSNAFSSSPVTAQVTGLRPGRRYEVKLVASNAVGEVRGATVVFNAIADPVPVIGRISPAPLQLVTGKRTVLRFALSERADVTVTIERLIPGRTVGGTCKPGSRTGPKCAKPVRRGVINLRVAKNTSARFVIPARVGGRTLAPGRYRVQMFARDLVTGLVSTTRTVRLEVTSP